VSDESGRDEVYVQAYLERGQKIPVSTEGETSPVWSKDGRELFYRKGDSLMAVPVKTGTVFAVGKPEKLFDQQMVIDTNPGTGSLNFDVSADGRFLMIIPTGKTHEVELVLNWFEELKRLGLVK
jgi:hypothetical protein